MLKRTGQGPKRGCLAASLGALLVISAFVLFPTPACADITDPDVMQFNSVSIAHNLYEDGDMLLIFHYAISWADPENQPEEPANQTFIFRLMDEEETETLGFDIPYPYVFDGYEEGIGSMYWDAESAPEWGANRILRLEENPGLDPSPKITKSSISGDDYSIYSDREDNQDYVKDYLIDTALPLEIAWEVEPGSLIGDDNYLTSAGETYFQGAIPGLKIFCPDLFSLKEYTPETDDKEWTQTHQEETSEQWEESGWVQDALNATSDLMGGIGWQTVTTIGCVILFLALLAVSHSKFRTTKPGMLLGIIPLSGGVALGFFPLVGLGLVCFGGIMFLAYVFWFKGAS